MFPTLCKSLRCHSLEFACRRSISSKAKFQSPHDKRMEALVSLYHQSNTFITPENLSAVIDQAFTQPLNIAEDQKKHSFAELFKMKQHLKESSKFFLGRDDGSSSTHSSESMGPGWTESRSKRVDRVYRALMGTQRDGRPSWLALKENSERVKSQLDKDTDSKMRR
ncbi:hypothetical protein HD554DRAFT_125082 [Boletus coccyginus]|nr:hypothetical protein HD554DRAFT_125082 [Boletus coccyginus]